MRNEKWLNLKLESRVFTEGLVQHTPMRFGRLMCFLQSLRPHFLCRYCDRKFARSPPKPIASVVRFHSKKKKKLRIEIKYKLKKINYGTIFQ